MAVPGTAWAPGNPCEPGGMAPLWLHFAPGSVWLRWDSPVPPETKTTGRHPAIGSVPSTFHWPDALAPPRLWRSNNITLIANPPLARRPHLCTAVR
jgi:hypothetical protein